MSTVPLIMNRKLGQYLIACGVITKELEVKVAKLDYSGMLHKLWEQNDVDQEKLAVAVADYLHLPYVAQDELIAEKDVAHLLSSFDNEASPVLPLSSLNGSINIAVSDPFDLDLRDRLEGLVNAPVTLYVSSVKAVTQVLHEAAGTINRLDNLGDGLIDGGDARGAGANDAHLYIDENSAPIVKLVNTLLREAVAKKASDIHIENQLGKTLFRYRVDGVLRQAMEPLESYYQEPLISRVKIMAELDITERHVPQDGRIRMVIDHRPVDFRVSVLPGMDCEDAVIRVLDSRSIPTGGEGLRLESLGMDSDTVAAFRRIISNPAGMIIVTGPTGSGKTTTLYAALNELNHDEGKTITIEDPVEYRLQGILQVPVNEKKQLTFSRGLRSILRHDPDRIMVGEIRDRETAEIAVQSSLTGHLLFTTIHANNPLDVINRFSHMGIKAEEVIPSLACIVSQRLVRKICSSCKVEIAPDVALLNEMGVFEHDVRHWIVYDGEGCEACGGTGYSGRIVVAEILKVTPAIAEHLVSDKTAYAIKDAAKSEGIKTLLDSAIEKVKSGVTSIKEIRRVIGSI
jgi:type IV pilus assembly protein PilB